MRLAKVPEWVWGSMVLLIFLFAETFVNWLFPIVKEI